MNEQEIYQRLGKLTEEMYSGISKAQSSIMIDNLVQYYTLEEERLGRLLEKMYSIQGGEMLQQQRKKLQILSDDFINMKSDIGSKYKVYLRGCGNAGKSTLLNALLSIDEQTGSKMGKLPTTFIIDIYTDELSQDEAVIRIIDKDGKSQNVKTDRSNASEIENREEEMFSKSKELCKSLIEKATENVYLEEEIADIEYKIYKEKLFRTTIREIKWGIGQNDFFHNCVLIDTPGLSQELRFTNVLDTIKDYEADGIIWVMRSDKYIKQSNEAEYKKELEELPQIYKDKKVIAVINMYGEGKDYVQGSQLWKRVKQCAEAIYCGKYGFEEIICVNAKLAYDGNLENNQKKILDSNISELRKKINEMFMEKNSEDKHKLKVTKIESFMNNLYDEIKEYIDELKGKIDKYNDLKLKIQNQESACKGMVQTELEIVKNQQLAVIKSNIEANLSRIDTLEDEPQTERDEFVKRYIIQKEQFEARMDNVLEKCEAMIYERFKQQQVQSIMSGYKTQKYALQSFEKHMANFQLADSKKEIDIKIEEGFFVSLFKDIFGKDSIMTSLIRGLRNTFTSPKDRIYKVVKREIDKWMNELSLDEEIKLYADKCYETLDTSMIYECGSYDDICELINEMNNFMGNRTILELEEAGLADILGG